MGPEASPNPQSGTRVTVGLEHGAGIGANQPPALIVPVQEEPELVATSTATVEGAPVLPYLTPDAMLVYCQSRLDGINTQCRDIMTRQEKNSRSQGALGDLQSALVQHQDGYNDAKVHQKLVDAYASAIAQVGANSELGKKLAENRDQWLLAGPNNVPDVETLKGEMDSLITSVKSHQSNLNSNAEIGMIQMQSLMSQRQTAIQLTTNIIQSLNEQANKIVANIGR